MSVLKCKMCGGTLEIRDDQTVGTCEFCGTEQTLSKSRDEVIQNLFNRANNLRLKAEFDKAQQIYEKIVAMDSTDAEAYWGIVLCKYGIEYVEEAAALKRVPTCHRTQVESVLSDVDYLSAVENATADQKHLYQQEAREIDRLQKDILLIASNEAPFDVFICYKETDENGRRTPDSVTANEIYHQLTQEGLKVFYAAITLEDKLGQDYEPYIFAALHSAKVMLVVGSKPAYFSAIWVKNEWSRYLKLMKNDRKKLLIPCYKDMDAYDLPEEFSHLQAQDMGKIGFINDVVRGIRKVVQPEVSPLASETTVTGNAGTAPLLKRAFLFLEDGDFDRADAFCEQVLNQDPENAQAYLGKLMAHLRCRRQEALKNVTQPFDSDSNYQKALRFGDAALKNTLQGYLSHINDRNELARKTNIYNKACNIRSCAKNEQSFEDAQALFASIPGFRDADELAEQCLTGKNDCVYHKAQAQEEKGNPEALQQAIRLYTAIPGWKDADLLKDAAQLRLETIRQEAYGKGMACWDAQDYTAAVKHFQKAIPHANAQEMANKCRTLLNQQESERKRIASEKAKQAKIQRQTQELQAKLTQLTQEVSRIPTNKGMKMNGLSIFFIACGGLMCFLGLLLLNLDAGQAWPFLVGILEIGLGFVLTIPSTNARYRANQAKIAELNLQIQDVQQSLATLQNSQK